MQMGREFDLEPFMRFGQDLSDYAVAFDVEKIALSLARLSVMVRREDNGQENYQKGE
jgi:hypothetical protein